MEGMKATHIPGAANTTADWLSRPAKQNKESLPAELEGLVIQTPAPRQAGFYSLPPPGAEPGFLGSRRKCLGDVALGPRQPHQDFVQT